MAKLTYSTSDSILEYIEESSKEMGLSKSAFLTLCVNQHKQTKESIAMTAQFQEMVAQVNSMSNEGNQA